MIVKDDLTNLYNRRFFHSEIVRAIQLAKKDRKYFSLAILDVDYFKQYNDEYGHLKGDEVLKAIGSVLKESGNRSTDISFRLGGEEFAITFQSLDPQEAYNFVNSLREKVEALQIEHKRSEVSQYITISLGLVTKKTTDSFTEADIYREADQMLSTAKSGGRNRVWSNIEN